VDYFLLAVEIVSGIGVLVGAFSALWKRIQTVDKRQELVAEGQKCQLRSDMLRTYYKHKDDGKIRQYELENFMLLYEAYKAMNGNSFIEKIYKEVIEWEVES
jgi:hypothetical protein